MVLLKVVIPVMLDDTVIVSVADVDCPAESVAPSLFQVMVIYVPAPLGLHPEVARWSVMVPVPVFLI